MQRDILLLTEMIDAAEQAHQLTAGITIGQLETDRQRRDALLWNFTVPGEAAGQLSAEVKNRFPGIPWPQPIRLRKPDSSQLKIMAVGHPGLTCCR